MDEKDELLSETKNLTKGQMEAHMIATRIADMKQHMQVTDKESGQLRPRAIPILSSCFEV